MNKKWWKESVIYQVYPRSYKDGNGDGVGDIIGLTEKLDHIKSLGVDVIWLCPVYDSPNADNGYDISNYRKIASDFGGERAFDELLKQMHLKGLKLVMDLVVNHTSDEHHWFEEAKKSKDNPYRNYYIWKDGVDGNPPNNWESFFSGSAWQYEHHTNQYYLHYFTKKQPDLNWENPKVRQEVYDIMDFWFKKGIDGFRMDVISLISKPQDFPNSEYTNVQDTMVHYYANGPRIHEYLQEMNKEVLIKYDITTVGEGPGIDLKNGHLYVAEERKELQMVFHFDHMYIDVGANGKYDPIPIDLVKFKKVFSDWDKNLIENKGWGSIFLGNHDFSRVVSRFGNDTTHREASAKLFATLLLTLRGTTYIYQGDEIGMTNVAFETIEEYNDVECLNAWNDAKSKGMDMVAFMDVIHLQSRDNARTPIQWNDGNNAGFTTNTPWLKINPNYININIASQEKDPSSILNYYREMIAYRKQYKTLVYGNYLCLDQNHKAIYAYRRWDEENDFLIILNLSDDIQRWDYDEIKANDYTLEKSNLTKVNIDLFLFEPWQSKLFRKL